MKVPNHKLAPLNYCSQSQAETGLPQMCERCVCTSQSKLLSFFLVFTPLALLHISVGTSKVLVWYFQVGACRALVVFRREFGRTVFISLLLRPFCSQSLSKCPRPESISVLKRPCDSGAALFSVTPCDRSLYASGTVRSTASNNAPYIDTPQDTYFL